MKPTRMFIIIFFLITSTRVGYCQPWYFNQIYNPNETWAGGLNIIGTPNGYFGCTISGDSVSDYFYNTCTFLLDETGNLVFWKNYGQDGYDYYPGYYGSLIPTKDTSFALFGSRHDLYTNLSEGIYYKFNALGDTILSRIFTSDLYNTLIGRTCTTTSDNGFALLGEVQNFSGYSDAVLIKTDSTANETWRRQFGTEIDDWAVSIAQTADSGYILGTWAYVPVQIVTADPIVIKTDSQGNFEWSLNLGGPYGDDKAIVCNTQDSCIMVLTAYADSMWTPEHAYTRINLVKIDLDGNVIWNKKYGPSKPVNYISNISSSQNGNFILCGYSMILDPSFANAGWIMEVDSGGDSLWYKDYYYFPPGSGDPFNELYDISFTEDHGFIATGQAYTLFNPKLGQNMWMLKVDSVGCEVENCWVGIDEEGSGEIVDAESKGDLNISPNPASTLIRCQLPRLNNRIDGSIEIYDLLGRKAATKMVSANNDEVQIDVGNLPRGLYLVVYKEGNKVIGSSKMIISR